MNDPLSQIAERLRQASRRATHLGLDRLELRYVSDQREHATCAAEAAPAVGTTRFVGIAARALRGGAAGDAGRAIETLGDLDGAIEDVIAEASSRCASAAPGPDTEEEAQQGHYEDAPLFEIGEAQLDWLRTRLDSLRAGSAAQRVEGALMTQVAERAFARSDGSCLTQRLRQPGLALSIFVEADGELARRSLSAGRARFAQGWEPATARLEPSLAQLVEEARALALAARCSADRSALVLAGEALAAHLGLVGEALRAERVLAGRSFVGASQLGRFRCGSPRLNLAADARLAEGAGSFGWDDEGVPARRTPLVQRGQLVGLLTSRRSAAALGLPRSGGCGRATQLGTAPVATATNLVLEAAARGPSLEELVADTREGLLLLGDLGGTLQGNELIVDAEAAWEIRAGKRHRLVRTPRYRGRLPQLWGACDAVGGTPIIAGRLAEHGLASSHGGPPIRLREVEVEARRAP